MFGVLFPSQLVTVEPAATEGFLKMREPPAAVQLVVMPLLSGLRCSDHLQLGAVGFLPSVVVAAANLELPSRRV